MINNLYDYIVEQFQHETDIVRIIDHIPEFPGKTGNHELKMMEIDGICIEAITNSSFHNHILYKIPIETDSFLEYQKNIFLHFLIGSFV